MLRIVVFALAAGLLLAPLGLAEEPKNKPAPSDENGTWVPEDGMSAGKKLTDNQLANIKLLLRDGKYTTIVGEDKEEGIYKVDTSKSPHPIDIEASMGPNKGKKIPAIVELKGDTMRVCYNPEGAERPKDFVSTEENKFLLISYKRAKGGEKK